MTNASTQYLPTAENAKELTLPDLNIRLNTRLPDAKRAIRTHKRLAEGYLTCLADLISPPATRKLSV
jgi:hypothetical protein